MKISDTSDMCQCTLRHSLVSRKSRTISESLRSGNTSVIIERFSQHAISKSTPYEISMSLYGKDYETPIMYLIEILLLFMKDGRKKKSDYL